MAIRRAGARGRCIRPVIALVAAVAASACTTTERSIPATASTSASGTTTIGSSTTTGPTPDQTSTTTEPPVDAALLAGARVLCSYPGPDVPTAVIERVRTGRAAGVLLFGDNVENREHTRAELARLQRAAAASPVGAPAIVAVDQEGGIVARIPGPPSASAAEMGTWPPDRIRSEGVDTAANLLDWGINVDLAPVSDVVRPGSFIDLQHRSFSADPDVAAASVAAFVAGLRTGGVVATVKHVPGLGAATVNTDEAIASVPLSLDELRQTDLVPIRAGVDAGAGVVMMSSAVYPTLDERPAVLSPDWVGTVVRGELGFRGVIVSDALDTPSLAPYGSLGEIAVLAARAGVDLFIASDPTACGTIQSALQSAIDTGSLQYDSAKASYDRIIALRSRLAP